VNVVFWQVEVSASDLSLLKMGPTDCSVSECDREASKMRNPRLALGRSGSGGGNMPMYFECLNSGRI
jgi:hypothetical protein